MMRKATTSAKANRARPPMAIILGPSACRSWSTRLGVAGAKVSPENSYPLASSKARLFAKLLPIRNLLQLSFGDLGNPGRNAHKLLWIDGEENGTEVPELWIIRFIQNGCGLEADGARL